MKNLYFFKKKEMSLLKEQNVCNVDAWYLQKIEKTTHLYL